MAVTPTRYGLTVACLGVASFIFGILAEHKKPPAGVGVPGAGKGVIVCRYPSDPTAFLGYLSLALLGIASVLGYNSLFYRYGGKAVPRAAVFGSTWLTSHMLAAVVTSLAAAVFLMWPTIEEQLHHSTNIHLGLGYGSPTAKTGLLGGGAFVSLNATLFWLMSLVVVINVREDYFDEREKSIVV